MTKRPQISVVVPNYNYSWFLDRLLACIANQGLDPLALEVIAVDDGSSDGSLEILAQWEARLAPAGFTLVALAHSGLPARVRNAGFSRARGEFILGLDPDDEIGPDFLEACLGALSAGQGADFAYTDWIVCREENEAYVKAPEYAPGLLATQNPWPSAALMRRKVWEKSAGFRENTAYEDWDFWVQAAASGFRGVRAPGTHFIYHRHGSSFSGKAQADDARAKAAIVMNNKAFFDSAVVAWARGIMRGAPWAGAMGRGLIPRPEDAERIIAAARTVSSRKQHRAAGGARG